MSDYEIILASSSQTRQDLMNRLGLQYRIAVPDIDESAKHEQHADDLAHRLAFQKARVISDQFSDAIVIGSDQVAWRMDHPTVFIGKPMTTENAVRQLQDNSGQTVCFSTALSVQQKSTGFEKTLVEHYQVRFRHLSLDEIERYVAFEQPLYCAGSFKCEGLGISLFEEMLGRDQTTLMGIPMIQLCQILRSLHIQVP